MAQNNSATTENNLEIARELVGEGRVSVAVDRETDYGNDLQTEYGTLKLVRAKPDSVMEAGADCTRYYKIHDDETTYVVGYSIDGTPGNETHTVLVKEEI